MSMFTKKQILMDAVSWSLYWEKRHELDPFTRWQADFIRCMFVWLTQKEENEFDTTCKAVFQDMEGRSKYQSNYFYTSKALFKFLRHSNLTYLFDSDGTVNIGSTLNELGPQNPTQCHMSPRDFAAMLICNDKQRFQISSMSIGFGNRLDFHQHNHGISGWVQFKDIRTKLSIHMIFTMLLHLKNHVVLVGFFMLQAQTIDNPLNRTDCWKIQEEKKVVQEEIQWIHQNGRWHHGSKNLQKANLLCLGASGSF